MNIEKEVLDLIKKHNLNRECYFEGKYLKGIELKIHLGEELFNANETITIIG
jgi:hypothetical protein